MSDLTPTPPPGEVTQLLDRMRAGEADARDRLYAVVYNELRGVAQRLLVRERPGHTLQATALVNEAWFKLAGTADIPGVNRAHFVRIASRAMRQVLVDYARRRQAARRGAGAKMETLDPNRATPGLDLDELLALEDALVRLDALSPRLRQVVECRYFGGMTEADTALALGVTERTVQRDWARARAWLYQHLYGEPD